jgi:hypothetical protein
VNENIPEMHTSGDFIMPGGRNIPVCHISRKIFKNTPATNKVNIVMLF